MSVFDKRNAFGKPFFLEHLHFLYSHCFCFSFRSFSCITEHCFFLEDSQNVEVSFVASFSDNHSLSQKLSVNLHLNFGCTFS